MTNDSSKKIDNSSAESNGKDVTMKIREVKKDDLKPLLTLYMQLHDNSMPAIDFKMSTLWHQIIQDENHHILVGETHGQLVCSCVLILVPNLTHNQRPYALIENVITDQKHRNKGFATALLSAAKNIARKENCYKIMLMTGSKKEETHRFYAQAGFTKADKTAFIQWLD